MSAAPTLEELSTKLDEAQDRVAMALEACGAGVWDWDLVSGRLFWDAATMRLFGVAVFGGTYADFERCLQQDDAVRVRQQLDNAIENRTLFNYAFQLVTRPGVILRGRGKCYYRNGTPTRFVGVNVEEIGARPSSCPLSNIYCPSHVPQPDQHHD